MAKGFGRVAAGSANGFGKDLVSINDLSSTQLIQVLDLADELKKRRKEGKRSPLLAGKTLAMLFEKPSTRTRASFEVAMNELGGHAMFVDLKDSQLGRGETVSDTAKAFSVYVHAIMARLESHETMSELAACASVPVISGLDDVEHPCQALADLQAIREQKGKLGGLKIAFVGDGENNVTHSLLLACAKLGVSMSVGCPKGYGPLPAILAQAKKDAAKNGCAIEVVSSAFEAVQGVDAIVTDTWISMGDEATAAKRIADLQPFQVNSALMARAKKGAIFLHCLPAHRGQEVTAEVIDGPQSIVWSEAENRLHVQKAVLALLMK